MRALPPLSETLNCAVLALAARHWPHGWETTDEDTQPAVERAMAEICGNTGRAGHEPECWRPAGRFPVWAGASDRTIFGDPAVNHAFRAWHDAWHLRLRAPFTEAGERRVCGAQRAELAALADEWPAGSWRKADALLHAEVVGQLEHQQAHGAFPVNQRAFVRAYVRNPSRALSRIW